MNQDELLDQLAQLPNRTYSYILIAALVGPLVLRLFGLKALASFVRPVALGILLGGLYAKQQSLSGAHQQESNS